MKIHSWLSRTSFAAGILALAARAPAVDFNNATGDYLYSNTNNWSGDPVGARVDILSNGVTTASNPAIVDWSTNTGNTYIDPRATTGSGYARVISGGRLDPVNLYLGNAANKQGYLEVMSGGTLDAGFNTGTIFLGLGGSGAYGLLTIHSGADVDTNGNFNQGTNGVLRLVADATTLPTLALFGDTTWNMNGVLSLDFSAFAGTSTNFTLIVHQDDELAGENLTGSLRTVLDDLGGSLSGTGSGTFSNVFEMIGFSDDWTLSYVNGGSIDGVQSALTLSIIPEPSVIALLLTGLALPFCFRRQS